jgi:isocitrate/isopropylmalate dehydrogenase
MMLEHLGDADGAQLIENAVGTALRTKTIPGLKAGSIDTDKAGDAIIAEIKASAG